MRTLVVLIAAASALGAAPVDPAGWERSRQDNLAYEPVPLVAVLANLDAFDGKRVRVSGYLTLEFENAGLAVDKVSYDAGLPSNALWVDPPGWLAKRERARLSRRYATVYATVDAQAHGHVDAYSGSLVDVRRIAPRVSEGEVLRHRVREAEAAVASAALRALVPLILLGLAWPVWRFWRHRRRSDRA